jgi:signal transduction histidine kinase/ligand-binding sensor domain-containing protein
MDTRLIPTPLRYALFALIGLTALMAQRAPALESRTPLAQYFHRVWRFGDANLLGTPQGITQTTDGYIWVSTSNGLFRFDGVRFTRWLPPAGETVPSDSMWYLFGARDGSLYIGTDRGLARITAGHVHTYPGSPRWPGPFAEDHRGNLWMGVSGVHSPASTLCRVDALSLSCLGSVDGFDCSRGIATTVASDGSLLIGSPEGSCRWMPDTSPHSAVLTKLPGARNSSQVRAMAVSSDGALWAGTNSKGENSGLLRFSEGRWVSFQTSGVDGRKLSVSCLLGARNGELWIGTSDEGLYRLSGDQLEHLELSDGLSDRNILALLEGREGGIWVVTPAGVEYFRDYAVSSLTSREGVVSGHAKAVAADRHDNVFLGSDVLVRLGMSSRDQIRLPNGNPIGDIRTLFVDSRDDLWIATGDRLLLRDRTGTIEEIHGYPRNGGDYIDYITEDESHDIWAALHNVPSHESSLLRIHAREVTGRYPADPIFEGQVVNALAPHPSGGLWVGGSVHGLFWFHEGHLERVAADGFDARVENLLVEPGGALWIVTQNGFVRYADGQSRTLDVSGGLPCASGVDILDDGRGWKWFYMHCGIERISNAGLLSWWQHPKTTVEGRFFGPLEGARPNLSNGSPARTSDGRLWSATDYAFQVIDSRHLPFNTIPPGVVIERLTVDGRDYLSGPTLMLPVNTRQIELYYTGLSFRIPEKVRFRYRLEGHDTQWIDANTRREAFYNDLPSGNYLFRVIACNNDDVWNTQGATLAFTILPAFYQTWTFRALAIVGFIVIAVLVYWYRLQAYAAVLKQRFDERLRERTRLARDLHDTLLQTIQGSKLVADDAREHVNDPKLTGRALDRLSEWLDRASVEGRAALEALRSSVIDTNNLAATLRRVAEDFSVGTDINIAVMTVGAARELHPIARDEVYRIAHEAIRNAVAHSGASELWVELNYGGKFRLEIRDNGRGIESAILLHGRSGHYGLAGMRERAAGAGGKLQIFSSTGGTTVVLTVDGRGIYKRRYGLRARLLDRLLMRRRKHWN